MEHLDTAGVVHHVSSVLVVRHPVALVPELRHPLPGIVEEGQDLLSCLLVLADGGDLGIGLHGPLHGSTQRVVFG